MKKVMFITVCAMLALFTTAQQPKTVANKQGAKTAQTHNKGVHKPTHKKGKSHAAKTKGKHTHANKKKAHHSARNVKGKGVKHAATKGNKQAKGKNIKK